MSDNAQIETDSESRRLGATEAGLWLKKINAQLELERNWRTDAKVAIKIYEADEDSGTDFNILHSNVETLVPALYNSQPSPDVRRRFGDADNVAKNVTDISERLLSYTIDQYELDDEMLMMIRDSLVVGRGIMRVIYEPILGEQEDLATGQPVQVIKSQDTHSERIAWDRVVISPAKSWAKVQWVAIEHHLDKDEMKEKGFKHIDKIGFDNDDDDVATEKGAMKSAKVWEVWDKKRKEQIWISDDYQDFPLKVASDPLGLKNFFPILKPVQPIVRISSMIPVCPHKIYETLTNELDTITKRISKLIKQLRVRGLVASELGSDMQALMESQDGEYTTAQAASLFENGGGLEKAVAHWPLEPTVRTLQQLYVQREQVKQTIYEVTGLSDILRGASNANETATAQQIKTQWGSLRVQKLQGEIARLSRDMFRKMIDIFSRHYTDQTISQITGLPDQKKKEQVEVWPQVLKMFKSDLRSFNIDIETDSTIRADMSRSQESMNSFLEGTGRFAQAMGGIVQLAPDVLPVVVEVYTSFARKFKLGKQAEDALDQLQQQAAEMMQNKEEEEKKKREAQQQQQQHEAQIDTQKQIQIEQAKSQQAQTLKQMDIQGKLQEKRLDIQSQNEQGAVQPTEIEIMKLQLELRKMEVELQIKETELALKQASLNQEMEVA